MATGYTQEPGCQAQSALGGAFGRLLWTDLGAQGLAGVGIEVLESINDVLHFNLRKSRNWIRSIGHGDGLSLFG